MEIEEKYFKLLHLLIHDKRNGMNGILYSLQITQYISGYGISYSAYMNKKYGNVHIYVEDFENGNVVFLQPFGVTYMVKEMEEMSERHKKAIKEFFGDKFREDMLMRISEDERQEEIRKWESLTIGIENWDRKME